MKSESSDAYWRADAISFKISSEPPLKKFRVSLLCNTWTQRETMSAKRERSWGEIDVLIAGSTIPAR